MNLSDIFHPIHSLHVAIVIGIIDIDGICNNNVILQDSGTSGSRLNMLWLMFAPWLVWVGGGQDQPLLMMAVISGGEIGDPSCQGLYLIKNEGLFLVAFYFDSQG